MGFDGIRKLGLLPASWMCNDRKVSRQIRHWESDGYPWLDMQEEKVIERWPQPRPHYTEASGWEIQIQVYPHVYSVLEKEKHTFSRRYHVLFISSGLSGWSVNLHCQVTWDTLARGPCTFGLEQWKWCWSRRQKTWVLILSLLFISWHKLISRIYLFHL